MPVKRRQAVDINAVLQRAQAKSAELPDEPVTQGPLDLQKQVETGPRDTPEAKEFADLSYVQHKPGETMRDRRPAGTNAFSLSEATRKRLGIKPEEEVAWAVNTRRSGLENFIPHDNLAIVLENTPGARLVKDPETGQPVRVGEHELIAYPRAVKEEHERRCAEEAREIRRMGEEHGLPGDRHLLTREDMLQMTQEAAEHMRSLGVGSSVFSPTAGWPFEKVLARMSRDEIEAVMERYRRQGRRPNIADMEAASAEEAREGRERQARPKTRRYWAGWRPE